MRHLGFNNASFLRSNLGQSRAEDVGVVKTDVGCNGQQGMEHICGIETPAKSDFDDCNIDFLSGELIESQRGD